MTDKPKTAVEWVEEWERITDRLQKHDNMVPFVELILAQGRAEGAEASERSASLTATTPERSKMALKAPLAEVGGG